MNHKLVNIIPWGIFSLFYFLPSLIYAQNLVIENDEDFRPRVVVVNLWSKSIDVQLGDQSYLALQNVQPLTPSAIQAIDLCAQATVYVKASTDRDWRVFSDSQGNPGSIVLKPWINIVIRIDRNGILYPVYLPRVKKGGGHFSFLNASGRTLDEFSLVDQTLVAKLAVNGLPDQALTNFSDLEPGKYGAMWRGRNLSAFTSGSKPGTIGMVLVRPDCWYMVIASTENNQLDSARIWELGKIEPYSISIPE